MSKRANSRPCGDPMNCSVKFNINEFKICTLYRCIFFSVYKGLGFLTVNYLYSITVRICRPIRPHCSAEIPTREGAWSRGRDTDHQTIMSPLSCFYTVLVRGEPYTINHSRGIYVHYTVHKVPHKGVAHRKDSHSRSYPMVSLKTQGSPTQGNNSQLSHT